MTTAGERIAPARSGMRSDHRRAGFVGLVAARAGTRPFVTVMGAYLTLVVATRVGSALAITFALTVHRFLSIVVYPMAGRLSDRTRSRLGRRVPYLVGSLAVMAGAVWGITLVEGYWSLVVLIVVARQASVVHQVTRFSATPDVFGRSRWLLAIVGLSAVAIVPSMLILAVIRFTWDQDDPTTWALTYRLAALFLLAAAVAVALLVRESPATRTAASVASRGTWLDAAREVLGRPNAKVMLGGAALLLAAGAATSRLFPVWAGQALGAGGPELVEISVATAIGSAVVLPLGLWLAGRADPRTLAVVACTFGSAVAFGHLWITDMWVFVGAAVVVVPLSVAGLVANVPLIAPLVPRADDTGEAYGLVVGPLGLVTLSSAYLSAALVDLTGDYRTIWVLAALLTLAAGSVFSRIRVPSGHERVDVRALLRSARRAAGSNGEQGAGGVVGKLFGGVVEDGDVLGRRDPPGSGGESPGPPQTTAGGAAR